MIVISLRRACAAVASYSIGSSLSIFVANIPDPIAGLWCAISAIFAIKEERRESYRVGWHRIIGSWIGALISAVILFTLS